MDRSAALLSTGCDDGYPRLGRGWVSGGGKDWVYGGVGMSRGMDIPGGVSRG